jgi:LuxR family transcriptional regulator
MNKVEKINAELQRLVAQGDWLFAVGLRIRFNHPTLLFQTYPEEWIAYYARNGLIFADPTVRWGMSHTGTITWAELEGDDPAGVLRQGRDHGLVHGLAVSVGDAAERSLGFFAHADRPITAAETAIALDVMTRLHDLTQDVVGLPPEKLAPYLALGDRLRQG